MGTRSQITVFILKFEQICVTFKWGLPVELKRLLGLRKFVRDMDCSSQRGLIIEPDQEALYGHLFDFLKNKTMLCVLIRSSHRGDSFAYTQHAFSRRIRDLELSEIISAVMENNLRTQERVPNSRGKRAISVRAIDVSVYLQVFFFFFFFSVITFSYHTGKKLAKFLVKVLADSNQALSLN